MASIDYEMKTMDIKGKPYFPVNERLKAFHYWPQYSHHVIETEVIECTPSHALVKASILRLSDSGGENYVVATGHAYELANQGNVNRSGNHLENCETSAIGRALGVLGIGIDHDIASADEVNASSAQAELAQQLDDACKEIAEMIKDYGEEHTQAARNIWRAAKSIPDRHSQLQSYLDNLQQNSEE